MTDSKRWRGLAALVVDVVTHGSEAVERVQKETVRRPLALLSRVTPVAPLATAVRIVHDASVTTVHAAIRLGALAAGKAVALGLDVHDALVDESLPPAAPERRDRGPNDRSRPPPQ